MTKEFAYRFIQKNRYAVLASVSPGNHPEAALVGIAVGTDLSIVFDTITDSRKYNNLIHNSSIAFVIGWNDEQTLQYEGIARIPAGQELEKTRQLYFSVFADGKNRERWPNIAHFVVEPKWIRFSDYNLATPSIEEMTF